MPAQNAVTIAERRRKVADLWLRGVSVAQMAGTLHASHATIRRDLEAIKTELTAINRESLEASRSHSLAVYRLLQQEAWRFYGRLNDDRSTNKPAALRLILDAEDRIARICGVLGPESIAIAAAVSVVRVDHDTIERTASDPDIARLANEFLQRIAGVADVAGIAGSRPGDAGGTGVSGQ